MIIDRDKISHSIDDFEAAVAKTDQPIALDLETSGLIPFISEPTWLSWACGDQVGAIPINHRNPSGHNTSRDCLEKMLVALHQRDNATVLWHNAAFDLSILIGDGWLTIDQINPKSIFDTMLASYVLNPVKNHEGGKHALKFLYREIKLDTDPTQPTFTEITTGREFSDVPFEQAKWYAGFDAWVTLRLHGIFTQKLTQDQDLKKYFAQIEMPHVLTTVEILTTGMELVGQDQLPPGCRSITDLQKEYDQTLAKVFKLAEHTFNFTSPDALRWALFSKAGIDPFGRGKKSRKFSVDKWTLARIFAEVEAAQVIDKHRNIKDRKKRLIAWTLFAKLLIENIKKHEEFVDGRNRKTDRIHPLMRQTTSSGRYSCRSPNTLSMSSTSKIKEHIVPGSGKSFVVADFGQIDLRVIANETAVMNPASGMAAAVNDGVDLHLNTLAIVDEETARLQLKRIHKLEKVELRNGDVIVLADNPSFIQQIEAIKKKRASIAKPLNFGISYGLGPKGLLSNLNNSDKFQDAIFKQFKDGLEETEWIASLVEQTKGQNKFTLERAHEYLETFHRTYPEIPKFQQKIEQEELQKDGSTTNIFGRRSRAEGIQHLLSESTVIDISTGHGEWYRVACRGFVFNKVGYDALVTKVQKLKVDKEIEDRKIDDSPALFSLDLTQFDSVTTKFKTHKINESKWRDSVFDIFENGMWGGEDFFEQMKRASPNLHPDLTSLSDHSCFPFVQFTHSQIKFIQTGPLATFMRYPGYDALRRKLISYRVSSTSMDICKIAMIEFRKQVKAHPGLSALPPELRPRIVNCIHDEIAVQCRTQDVGIVKPLLENCMSFKFDVGQYLGQGRELLVKIEADINSSDVNYALAKPA